MIEYFRQNPQVNRRTEEIQIEGRRYLAHFSPMLMKQECSRCHSDPKDAPAELIKRYGPTASFHRKLGDVVGIDRVAVPIDSINASLTSEMRSRSLVLAAVFALLFGSIFYVFRFVVTQRLVAMASHFDEIAAHAESTLMTPVEVKGNDEISVVGRAFNKLVEQLRATHASLEQRVSERTEELRHANAQLQLELTERKEAEEALRQSQQKLLSIFRVAPVGIGLVFNRVIREANETLCRMTGYSREQLVGQNARMLYPTLEDYEHVGREKYHQIAERGTGTVETRWKRKDGNIVHLILSSTPLDATDLSKGVTFTALDITERKQAEVERLRFNKLESLSTLAGGIAHDFNNILTAIIGNLSLAMIDPQNEEYLRKRLNDAERACLQAQALSTQLLTFAKGGAPIKKLVSLEKLITESATFASSGSQVRCEFSFPDNLWAAEVDPGQIGQVIQNLVINANQVMPTGGTIKVQGENLVMAAESSLPLEAGNYVKISIHDQGVGIPADHLPRIFDPYFTTKQTGSGLGLTTVYSIIKNHQGHISVESKLGAGTTFYIYLPAVPQEIVAPPEEDRELLTGLGKILVMDDEEMVREVLGRMLSRLGYEAEFAADGAQAVEKFSQAKKIGPPFAAVILDLTVPGGMGGKETIENLLKIDPQVKAVVSSGYSDDPIMANFKEYGFSEVIAKPYRVVALSRILQRVISK
jgi:PAS domain S-box-containing protein